VRLEPIDRATRDAMLRGDRCGYDLAPGWPHEDSEAGLSFLDSGGWAFLVIDDDNRVAGECGTKTPPDADGAVEIGYGLAAPSRGRGLGGAAVAALVTWLTAREEIHFVDAEVHIGNPASWRVLDRLGFVVSEPESRGYRRYRLAIHAR
jgi:RimJ/RimL family protein N-acetyltransferase